MPAILIVVLKLLMHCTSLDFWFSSAVESNFRLGLSTSMERFAFPTMANQHNSS